MPRSERGKRTWSCGGKNGLGIDWRSWSNRSGPNAQEFEVGSKREREGDEKTQRSRSGREPKHLPHPYPQFVLVLVLVLVLVIVIVLSAAVLVLVLDSHTGAAAIYVPPGTNDNSPAIFR